MNRRRLVLATALASTLVFAGTALAVITPLNDVELTGLGTTKWNYETTRGNHFILTDAESSPLHNDAFDDAFEIFVGDTPYLAEEGNADLTGTNRVTGTVQKAGKLKVSRTDDSFTTLPTLRVLVKLQNPKKQAVKTDLVINSSYGSDDSTLVIDSSSGDGIFNSQDRWGVTSDDPVTPSDTVVTMANYGKGKVLKPSSQRGPTSAIDDGATLEGNPDISDSFRVKVPGKKTVYVMLFAEVHDTLVDATTDVAKFDVKGLDADLLTNISASVRKKIVNWDLG